MSSRVHDDPRDASLETKEVLPYIWYKEDGDFMTTSGMFLAGLIVITRNRFMAWAIVLFGVNSIMNGHPMRSKEGVASWSTLLLTVSAFFSSYFPMFVITKPVTVAGAAHVVS